MLPARPEVPEPGGRVSWTHWLRFMVFCDWTISWAAHLAILGLYLMLEIKAVASAGCAAQMNGGFSGTNQAIKETIKLNEDVAIPEMNITYRCQKRHPILNSTEF